MTNLGLKLKKLVVVGSASVFGLLAVPLVADYVTDGMSNLVATAQAAEDGHGGVGGHGGSGDAGDKGQVKKGAGGSHESGAGGPSKSVEAVVSEEEDSGKKGPSYKGGGTDRTRGKPAWAQEGIPEVELGRLNVARAPGAVMDKQLLEALASLKTLVSADGTSLYEVGDLATAIGMIAADALRVDSPLANLALLKDFLSDGVVDGNYVTTDGTTNMVFDPAMSDAEFAALLLGSASDKLVEVKTDTVTAIETILGVQFPADNAATAVMADDVREIILYAHEN